VITLYEYAQTDCGFIETGKQEYEYSCPHCYKAIRWIKGEQLSPANCLGCFEQLMDISRIAANADWRIQYHFSGEVAVICESSVHG